MSRKADTARIDAVRALLDKGLGYAEIARRLGWTRNVVVGIAHRHKLALTEQARKAVRRVAGIESGKARSRLAGERDHDRAARPRPPRLGCPIPADATLSQEAAAPSVRPSAYRPGALGCRWISAKDPVEALRAGKEVYCGATTVDRNQSYCAVHAARIYTVPRAKGGQFVDLVGQALKRRAAGAA